MAKGFKTSGRSKEKADSMEENNFNKELPFFYPNPN